MNIDKKVEDYNFNDDIIVGEKGEGIILKDLEKMGAKFISDNKDIKYDLIMEVPQKPKQITYEIKTDVFCKPGKDTGNMFIEYECRGKLSGINATKSDWFVTYYPFLKTAWYIETNELRNLIKYNNFRETSFSGDQGSNTKGYLIPREAYKRFFIVRNIDTNLED